MFFDGIRISKKQTASPRGSAPSYAAESFWPTGGRPPPRWFFCTSMMIWAFSSSRWRRAFSRSRCATRACNGFAWGLRPRRRGSRLAACCARHVVKCEEYNPSRRNSAPIPPGAVLRSASRKIRSLYSAVNRRRRALLGTSGFGRAAAAPGSAPVASAPFAPPAPAAVPFPDTVTPFIPCRLPPPPTVFQPRENVSPSLAQRARSAHSRARCAWCWRTRACRPNRSTRWR